jgi:hypothetical protein
LDARLTTLPCENTRIVLAKSEDVTTGTNLAEYFKQGCGSKGAVLPMAVMNKRYNMSEVVMCL